jgi:choline-sulfatase
VTQTKVKSRHTLHSSPKQGSGKNYSLFVVSRTALILALIFSVLPSLWAGPPKPNDSPSVALISIDTLRADRLSCYGYRGQPTPHIDEIARGGTVFSAIGSQVPLTLPSHTCLLTSTYPFANGVEDNGQVVPSHMVTLASILKSHGYDTAAFIGGFVLDRRFGLDQGFDFYDSPFDLHQAGGTDVGDIKRLGGQVIDSAIEWLQANRSGPFFVFIHIYDLHSPYNVPSAYRERFGTGYEAELRYVDDVIGRFWNYLSEKGLLKNTLVVFTGDHGESLGEHGEMTHGYFIYQSTLWVPLIFHWPTASKDSFPSRVSAPAGLVDVAPTILQFAGIAPPHSFQGKSLLGLLKNGSPREDRAVYSESLYAHLHFGCSGLRSLRMGRYKYIDAPKPELYDLKEDPSELHNLYSQERSTALAYRERLLALAAKFKTSHPASARALSPETISRLSSLGYVAGTASHSKARWSGADPKDRIGAYREYGRAIEWAANGRLRQSNALLEKLLVQYPRLNDLRISLGLNDQRLGKQAEAAKEFKIALQNDPLNVIAHFDLGMSEFKLGQLQDAAQEFRAALAIAPYYTRAENLLGTIWLQQGNYEKAEQHFRHILTIDPGDYAANYDLGALAILQQQWDQAYQHLLVAVRVEPHNPAAHNTMGSYYLRRGDLSKAQGEFQQAIQIKPDSAGAHYNLGLVLLGEKKNAQAAMEFRRALSIDPRLSAARAALNRLESPGQ